MSDDFDLSSQGWENWKSKYIITEISEKHTQIASI